VHIWTRKWSLNFGIHPYTDSWSKLDSPWRRSALSGCSRWCRSALQTYPFYNVHWATRSSFDPFAHTHRASSRHFQETLANLTDGSMERMSDKASVSVTDRLTDAHSDRSCAKLQCEINRLVKKGKGKVEHFYSALYGIQTTLKRSGMQSIYFLEGGCGPQALFIPHRQFLNPSLTDISTDNFC